MKKSIQAADGYLDEEERELDALDPKTALSAAEKATEYAVLRSAAAEGVKKAVTMRLSSATIEGLKQKAGEVGIPYQTLASMVLQKFVRGAYLERDAVEEVISVLRPASGG